MMAEQPCCQHEVMLDIEPEGDPIPSFYGEVYLAALKKAYDWISRCCACVEWLDQPLLEWAAEHQVDLYARYVAAEARIDLAIETRMPKEVFAETVHAWARIYCQIGHAAHRKQIQTLNKMLDKTTFEELTAP